MIRSPLRAGVALACALSLSACGGGDGEFYLGGSILNNTAEGLILTNNGGSDYAVPAGATTFYFPELVDADSSYRVEVKQAHKNAEKCEVISPTGVGRATFNINTIEIVCTLKSKPLNVNVSGLRSGTLVLVNGSVRKDVTANGSFEMLRAGWGQPYGVTVYEQPSGQTCTVQNGVGTVPSADEPKTIDVSVTCA